jgi:hypothetical protein
LDTAEIIEYGKLRLWKLKSGHIDEGLARFQRKEFDGFSVSRHFGFHEPDLRCLLAVPHLKYLALSSAPGIALDALVGLPNLEWLSIDENEEVIDFSAWPRLKVLMFSWNRKRKLPQGGLSELVDLTVWRFPEADLSFLAGYSALETLNLFQSRALTSVAGVEKAGHLRDLALAYCQNLTDISALVGLNSLESLSLENLSKVSGYAVIAAMKTLIKIEIRKSAAVADIDFLRHHATLEEVIVKNTKILSGDLSPLATLPRLARLQIDRKPANRAFLKELMKSLPP